MLIEKKARRQVVLRRAQVFENKRAAGTQRPIAQV